MQDKNGVLLGDLGLVSAFSRVEWENPVRVQWPGQLHFAATGHF